MQDNQQTVSATLEAVRVAFRFLPFANRNALVVSHLREKFGYGLPFPLENLAEQAVGYAVIIATGADR